VKHVVELLQKARDSQRELQEREAKAMAEVRKVVGQLAGDVANLRSESGRERLAIAEVARANKKLSDGGGPIEATDRGAVRR
jgi:hypothetical protein